MGQSRLLLLDPVHGMEAGITAAHQLAFTVLLDPGRAKVAKVPALREPANSCRTQRKQMRAEECDDGGNENNYTQVQSLCMGFTEADQGKVLRREKCPGTMPECGGRRSTDSTAAQEPAQSTLTSSSSTASPSQGISHAGTLSELTTQGFAFGCYPHWTKDEMTWRGRAACPRSQRCVWCLVGEGIPTCSGEGEAPGEAAGGQG